MVHQGKIKIVEVDGRVHLTHYKVINATKKENFVVLSLMPSLKEYPLFIIKDYRLLTIEAVKLMRHKTTRQARLQNENTLMTAIAEPAKIIVIQNTEEKGVSEYINLYPTTNNKPPFLLSQTRFTSKRSISLNICNNSLWCITAESASYNNKKKELMLTSITSDEYPIIIHQLMQDSTSYGLTIISDCISKISSSQIVKALTKAMEGEDERMII